MIPVSEIATEFIMLPTGDIVGANAVDLKPGRVIRKRKNRARVTDMRTGFILVRSGVFDF